MPYFFTFSHMKTLIINGPNLNLLGKREPDTYGNSDFSSFLEHLRKKFDSIEIEFFQSNIEGELIDRLQEADDKYDGIILNAAAYTHTSVAIGDAVRAISTPVIEVHISNTSARESFRHQSFIAPHAVGVVLGFGLESYDLAMTYFAGKSRTS